MMTGTLGYVQEAGVVAVGLGGDHCAMIAGLRAAAERHGALALVQFDAHANTWDEYLGQRCAHGTVVRRAVEEGLVDPRRSTLMGMRGGLNGPRDYDEAHDMGFTVVQWEDLAQLGTGVVAAAVEAAGGKAFLAFDIDFVDSGLRARHELARGGWAHLGAGAGAGARLSRAGHRRRRSAGSCPRARCHAPHRHPWCRGGL